MILQRPELEPAEGHLQPGRAGVVAYQQRPARRVADEQVRDPERECVLRAGRRYPKRQPAAPSGVLDRGAQAAVEDFQHQAGPHVLSGSRFSAGSPVPASQSA